MNEFLFEKVLQLMSEKLGMSQAQAAQFIVEFEETQGRQFVEFCKKYQTKPDSIASNIISLLDKISKNVH